jgi:hypothetical protein
MGGLQDDGKVQLIQSRLIHLGLILTPFLDEVTRVYPPNGPIGFDFKCEDISGLFAAVKYNPHFGYDNPRNIAGHVATELAHGISFREDNQQDSLHFEIAKDICNVHIDSISVVAGKDESGDIIYNTANLLQHISSDHFNFRKVIAPNSRDGFVWGFRFGAGGG